ncbi:hypothetical protein [Streptomyces malaysiense]|uniref:Uncharacterized protein n=1 Tax=Streptomyces malaysiense TaxID=1428626 RepID=A0A1J4Q2N7_9ACTN|nr:hypothetical protein [Streptomyces malaysiense]OIK27257.1 hypothetical protein VT52_012345 [Streptomyces malaysiense]
MTASHSRAPSRLRYVFLAEIRKLAAPVVLAAFAVAAVVALIASGLGYQRAVSTFQDNGLAAGMDSWPGAVVLALRHLGTLVGLLAAVGAGVGVAGGEFENGTWGLLLLRQPRIRRLLAVKFATAVAVVGVLAVVLVLLLRTEGLALGWHYRAHPARLATSASISPTWDPHTPSWGQAANTLGNVLLIVLVYVAGGMAAAVVLRGVVQGAAVALGVPIVFEPLVLIHPLVPYLPSTWIAGWLHLANRDQYQTYLWNSAPSHARSALDGCLLAALGLLCTVATFVAATRDRITHTSD